MHQHYKTTDSNEPITEPQLNGIENAWKIAFPCESDRPSLRAWNDWRAKGYYSHVKIGKRVWIDGLRARRELEARFTIKANG